MFGVITKVIIICKKHRFLKENMGNEVFFYIFLRFSLEIKFFVVPLHSQKRNMAG